MNWSKRQVGPIGIDLGMRTIRMLQLAREQGQVAVVDYAEQTVPVDVHGHQEYELVLKSTVHRLLKEKNFIGRDVVVAVPWDQLQIRTLRVPDDTEQSLEEVVYKLASERFGIDPIRTEFDFLTAGDVREGTDLYQEIILLGADKELIGRQIHLLGRCGLHPLAIDAGPCTLFRAFERLHRRDKDHQKVVAIVDMGYQATRLVITRGTDLVLFKSIPIGGRLFDEQVAGRLGMPLFEASEIRGRVNRRFLLALSGLADAESGLANGESLHRPIFETLKPSLEQLSAEIALCLRYCGRTFRGMSCTEITAVGGEAYNQEILDFIGRQVSVPVQIGRPMQNVHIPEHISDVDRRTGLPEWTTVLGLALKPVQSLVEVGL